MLKETLIPYTPGGPRTKKLFDFDPIAHTYTEQSIGHTSVSKFISPFKKQFDKPRALQMATRSTGRPEEIIEEQWSLNNEIGTGYGDVVHNSIEYWVKFGDAPKPEQRMPKQKYLKMVVQKYALIYQRETLLSEIVIPFRQKRLAGTADLLDFCYEDPTLLDLRDIKTNAELSGEDIVYYAKQFNSYRHMIELMGYKVERMILDYWDGEEWNQIEIQREDMTQYFDQWNPEEIAAPPSKKSFTTDENIRFGQAYNLAFDYYSKAKNLDLQKVGDMAIEIYHNISQTKEQLQ